MEENKGRERIFDKAAVRLQNVTKCLRKALITDFFGSQDDTDANERMVGIGAICNNSSTVGGIDQSSYSWWRGNTLDNGGSNRDLTWALLNDAWYLSKKYGEGDPPTVIICSEGVLQNYEDLLTKVAAMGGSSGDAPAVQFMAAAAKGPRTIDGGFEAFFFKRIPMIADPFATANSAYVLNEKYINWRVLKNFDSTGWMDMRNQGQDWVQNFIYGYGALTSSANRKQVKITDLTEA